MYLLKSVIWLTGFSVVYYLFLRNERFFVLNRLFLLSGILTSLLFPFVSVHYTVVIPLNTLSQAESTAYRIQSADIRSISATGLVFLALYLSGMIFIAITRLLRNRSVLKSIKESNIEASPEVKIIRSAEYSSSFSFFSYVFVNPSVTDIETEEIVNHELAHIRQKHWIDLVFVELLCIIQWFNPVVWLYVRFIRQNHEYLADEVALQRTSDPAIYRAALLNQIVGSPVVSLANSFNYSLNKKRFNMMKNIIRSPYRKIKVLLILPVFAIVLFSFAKPDYKYTYPDIGTNDKSILVNAMSNDVRGNVVDENGNPLSGATITVKATGKSYISDSKGMFSISGLSKGEVLLVTLKGYGSKAVKADTKSKLTIELNSQAADTESSSVAPPPPPPPPAGNYPAIEAPSEPSNVNMNVESPKVPNPVIDLKIEGYGQGVPPIVVLDGIITDIKATKVNPDDILSVDVLKDEAAINKYGDKGKNGVIEITTVGRNAGVDNKAEIRITSKPSADSKSVKIKSENGEEPLVIIDGIITNVDINSIDPETIESINVLKDSERTEKYGEKGKSGVIIITTKKE